MKTSEICKNEQRRRDVRKFYLSGMDYIELSEDQCQLTVYFLGKAPENLEPENVRIEGGRRIRNIKVLDVDVRRNPNSELDDYMIVTVDRSGDFSTYTLRLIELEGYDKNGQPIYTSLQGCDPRYAELEFTFKAGCPTSLDCPTEPLCPPAVYIEPEINYLAKDYASFRQLMLDRLALTVPGWQERHIPDIGIALVELLAYVGDHLSYYQDAVATEAYLETARERISVRRHVRLVDYILHEGCNARTWVCLHTSEDLAGMTPGLGDASLVANARRDLVGNSLPLKDIYFITGHNDALAQSDTMLTEDDLQRLPPEKYEVFEPLVDDPKKLEQPLTLYAAHNEIRFYTWGDEECCLPRGATSATLQDYEPASDSEQQYSYEQTEHNSYSPPVKQLPEPSEDWRILKHLEKGDFLIFEEVMGAKTGLPEDANPTRRHVVRLTSVKPDTDELYGKNIVEIEWAEEDKLPFPFCISAIGPAQKCKVLENISVARGNVLLVDAGRTINPAEEQKTVPLVQTMAHCEGEDQPSDVQILPELFAFALKQTPLTYRQSLPVSAESDKFVPASQLLGQDPRQAVPQVTLKSLPPPEILPLDNNPSQQAVSLAPKDQAVMVNIDANGYSSLSLDGNEQRKPRTWLPQYDLLESASEDFHYVVEIDNDGYAHLRFGDGELGRVPEAYETFVPTYRIGNGPSGNVGAESISRIVFRHEKLNGIQLQPRNPLAARGGTLPEPLAEVKLFAPHAFLTDLKRAITADDYAKLVLDHYRSKVQRAAASLRWAGSNYAVLVAIDPLGKDEADQALLDEIVGYLEQYRFVGYDVIVESAQYVPLELAMTVCVRPHYLRGHVEAALLDLFSNRMLLNGKRGFFHADSLTFGQSIAVSTLVAAAQAVPGVLSVSVDKLERFGEGPNLELENGVLPIGPMEVAQLDNDPSFPEHGKLTLNMRGGR